MNRHDKPEQAGLVIDRLKLPCLNLQAEKICSEYKVQGYPTLMIVDGQEIIRAVIVGFFPSMKEAIIQTVDSLLSSP